MSISTILFTKISTQTMSTYGIRTLRLISPCGRLGRIEHMVRSNYSSFFLNIVTSDRPMDPKIINCCFCATFQEKE